MPQAARPAFRADHVGSLMRPEPLRQAREAWMAGKLPLEELRVQEDLAVREAVAMQERAGLQALTDGEFRRVSWRDGFFENVDGFSAEREEADFEFRLASGERRRASPVPRVVSKLVRRRGIATGEFESLKKIAREKAKVTLPSPSVMHFFRGRRSIDERIYPDIRAYMADVSRIYREELADLARLGCSYVQLDEVALPIMCDPGARALVESRGESAAEAISLYIDALKDALRERPAGMTVCVHMCRGNVDEGMAEGGYEPIAERVFNELPVDGFLLEYDTPRAGDFSPLRFVPKGKSVALGLVSTKRPVLESRDFLRSKVDEAGRHLALGQLRLCPQCGFASGFRTRRMSEAEQERKLANMVEAADAIWAGH